MRPRSPRPGLDGGHAAAGRAPRPVFDDLHGRSRGWEESLHDTSDGLLVLHQGRVVYERYLGILAASSAHDAITMPQLLALGRLLQGR